MDLPSPRPSICERCGVFKEVEHRVGQKWTPQTRPVFQSHPSPAASMPYLDAELLAPGGGHPHLVGGPARLVGRRVEGAALLCTYDLNGGSPTLGTERPSQPDQYHSSRIDQTPESQLIHMYTYDTFCSHSASRARGRGHPRKRCARSGPRSCPPWLRACAPARLFGYWRETGQLSGSGGGIHRTIVRDLCPNPTSSKKARAISNQSLYSPPIG